MPRATCVHCGLPVPAARGAISGPIFCCYGCRLASRIVGAQAGDSLQAWTVLRLGVGAFLAMNVMMVSLLLYTGEVEAAAAPFFRWLMLGLATPAVAILGYPFALGAADELRRRRLSLDALILIGAFAGYAASAANTVRGAGQVYFDTATMLLLLVTAGKLIEATAKRSTGDLVRGLETLLPRTAWRVEADGIREVPLGDLRAGDLLRVRPGERVPADGVIEEGASTIQEASFTGEPRPRFCSPGERVVAGTVNGEGGLAVRAERVGEEVLLHRIVEMAEEATSRASPSERLAERAAAFFIPAVLLLAAGAGLYWLLSAGPAQAGFAALAVVVVACPCAMGIATPLATALALGRAARDGIVVRGGDVMERIGGLDVLFVDKTGTLTTGRPVVLAVESLDPEASEDEVLAWAAGLESGCGHSFATAIVAAARSRGLETGSVRDVRVIPGRGVRGLVRRGKLERPVVVGSGPLFDGARELPVEHADASVVVVAWDGLPRGRVLLRDMPRADASEAVSRLQASGVRVVLLSGDRAEAAQAIAASTGIAAVEAPRTPTEKVELIERATAQGLAAGMVGDGINDAPALSAASVGIALGTGTDLARQSGNVLLLSDRLAQIPWLVALSRRTRRVIRQNLAWAFGYNAVALAAAAAGLLHPLLAALAMVVSSVTVLVNSLRIQAFGDASEPAAAGLPQPGPARDEAKRASEVLGLANDR